MKVIPFSRHPAAPAAARRDETLSDEALLAACTVGDTAALGVLFDRHAVAVHRFLARITVARQADLDDLVQSTFLEVHRCAGKYRKKSSVRTWIMGIAVNVARHQARSEGRRRAMLARYAEVPRFEGARPDDAAERQEMVARLSRALEALPEAQRVAFVMCCLEGVPGTEAARALGVREGTLAWRLHEARKAVAERLGGRDET